MKIYGLFWEIDHGNGAYIGYYATRELAEKANTETDDDCEIVEIEVKESEE